MDGRQQKYAANLSKSAVTQADRAIRRIVKLYQAQGPYEGLGEYLRESSYEEAAQRNVYQSDTHMEEWWDWRSYVEIGAEAAIGQGDRPALPAPVSDGDLC